MKRKQRWKRKQRRKRFKELRVCHPNAAGVDLGSAEHHVAVPPGRDKRTVRKFSSFTRSLHEMADWLKKCGVDTVAMESTGVYWIPVYEVLEQRGFQVLLVNAHQLKGVPGRKSDVLDCQWIQQLHSYGLLRGSFRPPEEIVELRTYLRHRHSLVSGASRHIQQMQKALALMNIQLHNVVSDITGQTGMRIIRDIVSGTHDPEALALHRHYRCKATSAEIAASLVGNYRPEHLFSLRQALELYDFHQKQIQACDEQIDRLLKSQCENHTPSPPAQAQRRRKRRPKEPSIEMWEPLGAMARVDLTKIPGLSEYSALTLISEIGTDMTPWPSEAHFASWLHLAPGTKITGGRRLSGKTPPGNNRAANILRLAATTAGRTKTALGAYYRRMAARLGKSKAVVATAHKMARIIYAMLKNGTPYHDPGAIAYTAAQRKRRLRSLANSAKALGYCLMPLPEPPPPADPSPEAPAPQQPQEAPHAVS